MIYIIGRTFYYAKQKKAVYKITIVGGKKGIIYNLLKSILLDWCIYAWKLKTSLL